MVDIKIERVVKAEIPSIKFPKPFWSNVAKIIEGSILDNLRKQQQADGSALKKNARTTLLRKQALGRRLLSLVDKEHRFVKGNAASWKPLKFLGGKGVEVGPATGELKRLSIFVQKKGYTGWMGLNKEALSALKALARKEIKRILKKKKT